MGLKRQDLSPELCLLLASVRLVLNPNSSNDSDVICQQDVVRCDPELLIRLASHHGLIPWLATNTNLEKITKNTDEFDFSQRLHSLVKVQRFNSERQIRTAVEISKQLDANAVRHVAFKGPALMQQIYPDSIKSRMSDDLDLLVAPQSMSKALSVLESMSYSSNSEVDAVKVVQFVAEYARWYRGRDIGLSNNTQLDHHIDLHWKIADDFSFSADTNELLSNRVRVNTRYGALPTLPLHQHFVYLCSHAYSDYFFRLHYLVDVYLTMTHSDFDKDQALKLAGYHGVFMQVTQAMNLSLWLFSPSNRDINLSQYGQLVIRRLINTKGFTSRIHPNHGSWTRNDKNKHLLRQIKNRSSKSYWFSPIMERTKITQEQLSDWQSNDTSIFKLYSNSLLKQLSK